SRDWSSDVCSSDLPGTGDRTVAPPLAQLRGDAAVGRRPVGFRPDRGAVAGEPAAGAGADAVLPSRCRILADHGPDRHRRDAGGEAGRLPAGARPDPREDDRTVRRTRTGRGRRDGMTKAVIEAYYDAFNRGDAEAMLALLDTDVEHHVNEGGIRRGKTAFAEFCAHMNHSYRERLTDIVVFASEDGTRGAAEFVVNGEYL